MTNEMSILRRSDGVVAIQDLANTIILPNTDDLQEKAGPIIARIKSTQPDSVERYEALIADVKDLKGIRRELGERFDPFQDVYRKCGDVTRQERNEVDKPFAEAEAIGKAKKTKRDEELAAIAREAARKEQEKRDLEAKRLADEAAALLKKEAEIRAREAAVAAKEREAQAKEEAARVKADGDKKEAARLVKQAEIQKKLDDEAAATQKRQDLAAAERAAESAKLATAAPVQIVSRKPEVQGTSSRKAYSCIVIDFPALVCYVADEYRKGRDVTAFLHGFDPRHDDKHIPTTTKLNEQAKSLGLNFSAPGVRVLEKTIESMSRTRDQRAE